MNPVAHRLLVLVCLALVVALSPACEAPPDPVAGAREPGGSDAALAAGAADALDGGGSHPEEDATAAPGGEDAADAGRAESPDAVPPDATRPDDGDARAAPDAIPIPDGFPSLDVSARDTARPDGAGAATGEDAADGAWDYVGLCADYLDCSDACGADDVVCGYRCWYAAAFDCRECMTQYSDCLYGNGCVVGEDIDLNCFYRYCYPLYDVCFLGDTAPACEDGDGDGFGRHCEAGPDCDDADAAVHPGVAEVCDGRDQDCDGRIDEKLGDCAVEREWGVLVYMSADNDLTDYALFDIADLAAKGGTDDRVGVAVQVELNGAHSMLDTVLPPEWYERTWRMVVPPTPAPEWDTLLARAWSLGDVDLTDPTRLADFLEWGRAALPARRYLVILWDHGGGWSGILSDEGSFDFMTMPRLRAGLAGAAWRPDVLLFNACSMGMIEVVAELEGLADFVVASEEVSYGNPNGAIVARLHDDPTMSSRDAAIMAYDETVLYDESLGASYTIAAYDMAGVPDLVAAVDALGAALLADLDATVGHLDAILPEVQAMALGADRDLADLAHELQGSGVPALDEAAAAVEVLATGPAFLLRSAAANGPASAVWGPDLSDAHGLAIHLPTPAQTSERELTLYADVALSRRSTAGWDEFLAAWLGGGRLGRTEGDFRVTLEWTRDGAPAADVDLDLLLYEPETGWAAPYLGPETANAALSGDSLVTGEARETYATVPDVAAGTYFVLVRVQDPGYAIEPVTATIRFEDGLWPDNDAVLEAELSNQRPCFLGETVLPPDVLRGLCDDLWFAGKLIRDGERHPLVGDLYGDFGLRPLPGGPLSSTPPPLP